MSTSSRPVQVGLGIQTRDPYDHPAKPGGAPQDHHSTPSKAAGSRARLPRRNITGPRAPRRQAYTPADPKLPQDHGVPGPTALSVTLSRAALQSTQSHRDLRLISDGELGSQVSQCDRSRSTDEERRSILAQTAEPGEWAAPKLHRRASASNLDRSHGSVLPRDVTLLSFGGSHARSAAELKSLLGNSNARLKAGSVIIPDHMRSSTDKRARKEHAVALEQAKTRARVEVDIVLESDVCVQGGYLRGHIKVRVRKRSKKDGVILLSEGKIRVVGYESVTSEDVQHTFYQCAAPLSAVTDASRSMYESTPDDEGFAPAVEGLHVLPFAFKLPIDNSFGAPKGVVSFSSGISVRYIAMISIKVKDSDSGAHSIAHFYRHCEVWPYLNPASVFQPAPRPLQASTTKSMALIGNSSKVKLHAQMHRLYWPAGSRCPISLHVVNGSKKTIRTLVLTLVRTATVFRPRPMLDTAGDKDPDSCQTATAHKVVADSVLEICAGVTKGHASAKGWWTGIAPGRELDFVHYISLPAEALSITRARLLEVEYSVRVTASAGSLSPDVSVTLPIRIFNFLSIDPPPSAGLLTSSGAYIRSSNSILSHATDGPRDRPSMSMTQIAALSSNNKLLSVTPEELPNEIPLPAYPNCTYSLRVTNPDSPTSRMPAPFSHSRIEPVNSETSLYSTRSSTSGSDVDEPLDNPPNYIGSSGRERLGNLDLGDDAGSDEEVAAVLGSARVDEGRFANSLCLPTQATHGNAKDVLRTSKSQPGMRVTPLVEGEAPRMEGVGAGANAASFATRVQQKRRALAVARLRERTRAGSNVSGMPNKKSVSAFLPGSSTETEDDKTPRLGYPATRENRRRDVGEYEGWDGYSSGEPSSDSDAVYPMEDNEQPVSHLPQTGSRLLPRPPAPFPADHSPPISVAVPQESISASLSSTAIPASNSRILPTPPCAPSRQTIPAAIPPVPPIPPHILAMCSRQPSHASDPLRKAIIRPPRSPLRPLARDSETSSSSDSGSGVRGRVATLEQRVRSSQDGDFAYC